jgi:hypothetical protein
MHIKSFIMGLSVAGAFVLGCVSSQVVVPVAQATTVLFPSFVGTSAQQWEYHCYAGGTDAETIQNEANAAGQENWELIGAGNGGNTWCFKRPFTPEPPPAK